MIFKTDFYVTYTTPGPSTEWNIAVVMPVLSVFREEVIRIEDVRVSVELRIPVDFICADDNSGTRWEDVVFGY